MCASGPRASEEAGSAALGAGVGCRISFPLMGPATPSPARENFPGSGRPAPMRPVTESATPGAGDLPVQGPGRTHCPAAPGAGLSGKMPV